MKKTLIFLSLLTAIGTILYWVMVFTSVFPVKELVPGYVMWFMSFPLADFWIALSGIISAVFLLKNSDTAVPFGIACGSGLIFLGLNALLYGFLSGLIFTLTTDEIIELCIKAYCLTVGSFLIFGFWKIRNSLE